MPVCLVDYPFPFLVEFFFFFFFNLRLLNRRVL